MAYCDKMTLTMALVHLKVSLYYKSYVEGMLSVAKSSSQNSFCLVQRTFANTHAQQCLKIFPGPKLVNHLHPYIYIHILHTPYVFIF